MKIACISTSIVPAPTAHSMQLMKVCQALSQLGHQVDLIVPGAAGTDWNTLSSHYGLSNRFSIHSVESRPLFRRYDFDAELIYTWLLPVTAFSFRLPVILELHDCVSGKGAPWLYKRFIRSPGRKRLVLITKALKEKLEEQFGLPLEGIDHIIAPNGVELERYTNLPSPEIARKRLNLPNRPTVLYSGGFYPGRGIEILEHLAGQHPEIQFILAGSSKNTTIEWRERFIARGITNVILPGFIPNERLPEYQAAGDILVMPFGKMIAGSSGGNSVDICSPMKMFDYLASGRAIMASNLPVLREVLNEHNALLLPADDPAAWDDGLRELISNPQLRKTLAIHARRDAAKYSWLDREKTILKEYETQH
jgi:glycosyltransferase involved in cell wall biosynthesis